MPGWTAIVRSTWSATARKGNRARTRTGCWSIATPYQLLEGVLIALYATGAEEAFVGIKDKFTVELERLGQARDELRAADWQGADRIHVVAGPDEYLFGEEKSLLEVIEGKLPLPRILPPYMQRLFATMVGPAPQP